MLPPTPPSAPPPAFAPAPPRGRLTLFTGPMFSGKTARLVVAVRASGPSTLVLKPRFDTRDPGPRIRSRDRIDADARPIRAWPADAGAHPLVVIDELQFLVSPHYDGDVAADIEGALAAGISVTAAALDTDYRRRPFAVVERLLSVADARHSLLARCHRCAAPARWTAKIRDTGALLEPGDVELYEARCDRHWSAPVPPP